MEAGAGLFRVFQLGTWMSRNKRPCQLMDSMMIGNDELVGLIDLLIGN